MILPTTSEVGGGKVRQKIIVRRRPVQPIYGSGLSKIAHNPETDKLETNEIPVKPKLVVSQEGLNFIQDQKDFVESQNSQEDASAPNSPDYMRSSTRLVTAFKLHKISPYGAQRPVQSLQLISEWATTQRNLVQRCPSPASPSNLGHTSRRVLKNATSLEEVPAITALKEEQSVTELRNLSMQRFRGGRAFSFRSEDKVRASDKVKTRIISLFQSKKSTNDEEEETHTASLGNLKYAVQKVLQTEKRSPSPSAYITKKVSGIFKVVTREERLAAIKQKLQQVLSGESQAITEPIDVELPTAFDQNHNCVKEHLEIQKIQKLQVKRHLSIERRLKAAEDRVIEEEQMRSCVQRSDKVSTETMPSADLNAEFIQIMEGVKALSRPKVSPLSFDNDQLSPLSPITIKRASSRGKLVSSPIPRAFEPVVHEPHRRESLFKDVSVDKLRTGRT